MSSEHKALADRVAALEARMAEAELASYLQAALEYLSSDPLSSLTKSRVILEKLLLALYRDTMKKEPPRPMIGDMLSDKAFARLDPKPDRCSDERHQGYVQPRAARRGGRCNGRGSRDEGSG